jgi:multiple sugar transport system ATP-binding protein
VTAPALEVRGLVKRFGSRVALSGVDLSLAPSEFLVVLGPTGAGKTTLLRAIAGIESPDGGQILIDGRDGARLAPAERDVALVFQNFSLYPTRTVRANLEFPLRAPGRGLSPAEIAERVESAASLLHIERLLERPARALSGGEMQRVAIGRAIVRRPKLFLMDEPLSNLDAKLREELRVELRELTRRLAIATVWVTHDQTEALSMADRIAVLDAGRVLQTGAPDELYARPASARVARQLGTPRINVVSAQLDGGWWSANGARIARARSDAPARATLGIRPEAIDLDGGDSSAEVELVEDLGPVQLVLARWAGFEVGILADRSRTIRRGERVHPRVREDQIVVWPLDPLHP